MMTQDNTELLPVTQEDEDYFDPIDCWQCSGEGYIYGCSWDWQCNTYDKGEGTCLCSRRCDICNPPKQTAAMKREEEQLRKLLGNMLNGSSDNGE